MVDLDSLVENESDKIITGNEESFFRRNTEFLMYTAMIVVNGSLLLNSCWQDIKDFYEPCIKSIDWRYVHPFGF